MPTLEEIQAAYRAGPEQLLALLETLLAENQRLQTRVQELEKRLQQDSHNSHQPPSSDKPHQKRRSRKRAKSAKPPGGQAGHPGSTRLFVSAPAVVIPLVPLVCCGCGSSLAACPVVTRERRQVVEIPKPQAVVTEYQALHKVCAQCQVATVGQFPAAVTQPVQYGPNAKGAMTYLLNYQFLSYERTCEALGDLFGLPPAPGTVANTQQTAYEALAPVETAIKTAVTQAPVVHVDETGLLINGQLHWAHVASTATLTYYAPHPNRGTPALQAIDLLPHVQGWRVHDALASYLKQPGRFSLCNAHLLRDLTAIAEDTHQAWATQLQTVLRRMKVATEEARAAGWSAVPPQQRAVLNAAYTRCLQHGVAANPPSPPTGQRGRPKQTPAYNLLQRLTTHRAAVLAFFHHLDVPFDNNQAERDLRMFKVKQKVSGGFRSTGGAAAFCRIRGYLSTLRKQGLSIWAGLASLFAGSPIFPALSA